MTGPTRLTDERSKSPASLRRLIKAGRSEMPDVDRLRRVAHRLGFGLGGVPAGAAAAKGAGLGMGVAKICVVAVLVLGAGAGALAVRDSLTSSPVAVTSPDATAGGRSPSLVTRRDPVVRAPAHSSAPRALPPQEPEPIVAPTSMPRGASAPAVANATTPAKATPREPPAPTEPAVVFAPSSVATEPSAPPLQPGESAADAEYSLLEQAQRTLRADPRRALDLAELDARRHPSGALEQERELIAVEALIGIGRMAEARARAAAFFRTFPGSAHGPRMATLLGLDAGTHNP